MRNAAKHDGRGVLAMANKGANTNGFVTLVSRHFASLSFTPT